MLFTEEERFAYSKTYGFFWEELQKKNESKLLGSPQSHVITLNGAKEVSGYKKTDTSQRVCGNPTLHIGQSN